MARAVKIKFKILGKTWTLICSSRKAYQKKNGGDSLASTLSWKRQIRIAPHDPMWETIVHELVHAYLGEMCYKCTSEISAEDLEEIFAELMAKRGMELLNTATSLYAQLYSIINNSTKTD